MEESSKKIVKSKGKRNVRSRKTNLNENKVCPIFTDEFLDLYRKQKSEIRSLKCHYSQISERLKLKDAQEEQIRLNNQKMRFDIEEISQKNSLLIKQINLIEKEFEENFGKDFVNTIKQHLNDQDYQTKIQKIVVHLQL